MNWFKKIIFPTVTVFNFIIVKTATAQATDPWSRLQNAADIASLPYTEATPQRIIANVVVYVLGFLGLAFLASIIFAGWQWMSSGGNEEKIGKAKARLKNSFIGIVIVLSAYGVTKFVERAAYKATCTEGYYCPPAWVQPTGNCSTNNDCHLQLGSGWICSSHGNCIFEADGNPFCNSDYMCQQIYDLSSDYSCINHRCQK